MDQGLWRSTGPVLFGLSLTRSSRPLQLGLIPLQQEALQHNKLVAKDIDLEASVGVVISSPGGSRLQAGERPQLLRSRTLIWAPASTGLAALLAGIRS